MVDVDAVDAVDAAMLLVLVLVVMMAIGRQERDLLKAESQDIATQSPSSGCAPQQD